MAVTLPVVAACSASGSAASPSSANSASSGSGTSTAGQLSAACASTKPTPAPSTPKLTGQTINISTGAPPQLIDTQLYMLVQILDSWGANASIISQVGDPAAARAALSGAADIADVGVEGAINGGLEIFGPMHPKADYVMAALKSIHSVSQLAGKQYAVSNTKGSEAIMLGLVLQAHGLSLSSVTEQETGTTSVRVEAMAVGRVDATWVHYDSWITLQKQGYSDLASMATLAPEFAPENLSASPSWLKANPSTAVAVDRAWIESARLMDTNENCWVQSALAYDPSETASLARSDYTGLMKMDVSPVSASAYNSSLAQYNENVSAKVPGALNSTPPLSQWFTDIAWRQAVTAEGLQS
jgi:ABC-type nitrate/sulfonate/bicarbonate transport system substrate-binding protein